MILGPAAQLLAFTLLSLVALLGALGMATTMSMFRSGIFLMASFIGTSGLFILLAADLLGLLQVMMYIGGMLVMVLFMVLFMHDPGGSMMAGMKLPLVEHFFSRGLLPKGDLDRAEGSVQMSHQNTEHTAFAKPARTTDHLREDAELHAVDDNEASHAQPQMGHDAPSVVHDQNTKAHPTQAAASEAHHANHSPELSTPSTHQQELASGTSHEEISRSSEKHSGMNHESMDMSGMSMVTPVRPWAVLLGILTGVFFVSLLLLRPAWPTVDVQPNPNSAEQVGLLLMDKYMMAFEGAGLLILIGIFGAVYLGRPDQHPSASGREARVGIDALPPELDDDTLEPLMPRSTHDEPRSVHPQEESG